MDEEVVDVHQKQNIDQVVADEARMTNYKFENFVLVELIEDIDDGCYNDDNLLLYYNQTHPDHTDLDLFSSAL
jgi:hypothetical protein